MNSYSLQVEYRTGGHWPDWKTTQPLLTRNFNVVLSSRHGKDGEHVINFFIGKRELRESLSKLAS